MQQKVGERRDMGFAKNRKMVISVVTVALAAAALAGCAQNAVTEEPADESTVGQATVNYQSEGRYKDNVAAFPDGIDADLGTKNAEINAPFSYVDRNGFTVQPVPSDDIGWNISYLNADQRGCTSCHTLEDALMMLDTYHGTIFMGYPTEQTLSTCVACHIWANPLRDSIHATHLGNELFENKNGTCESCHYIDENGDFKRWDYEKYNLYQGITDVAASDADLSVTYDQETLTSNDDFFYKSIKEYGDFDASDWRTDDSNMDPELYNNWVFSVGGAVENPLEMTLPELVEKFGTVTTVMKQQCTINGAGNAAIAQVEVTGVPMQGRITAQLVVPFEPFEVDGYRILPLPADHVPATSPVFYAIEKEGKRLLYAHDTGEFGQPVWEALKAFGRFDLVSLDCTGGGQQGWRQNHMCLKTDREIAARMRREGLADRDTVFVANHFSHNGGCTHDELCAIAEKYHFVVAYDGLEIEF